MLAEKRMFMFLLFYVIADPASAPKGTPDPTVRGVCAGQAMLNTERSRFASNAAAITAASIAASVGVAVAASYSCGAPYSHAQSKPAASTVQLPANQINAAECSSGTVRSGKEPLVMPSKTKAKPSYMRPLRTAAALNSTEHCSADSRDEYSINCDEEDTAGASSNNCHACDGAIEQEDGGADSERFDEPIDVELSDVESVHSCGEDSWHFDEEHSEVEATSQAGDAGGIDQGEYDWGLYDEQPRRASVAANGAGEHSETRDVPARRSKKIWTKAHFPDGHKGPRNYSMTNIIAAQQWECPCLD
eukprot:3223146-Pleurochrysis_carterae.AAC.3